MGEKGGAKKISDELISQTTRHMEKRKKSLAIQKNFESPLIPSEASEVLD